MNTSHVRTKCFKTNVRVYTFMHCIPLPTLVVISQLINLQIFWNMTISNLTALLKATIAIIVKPLNYEQLFSSYSTDMSRLDLPSEEQKTVKDKTTRHVLHVRHVWLFKPLSTEVVGTYIRKRLDYGGEESSKTSFFVES